MNPLTNNITNIVNSKLCLGCGTCEGVCPSDAINMSYSSKNRTYIPVIDQKKCEQCSLCCQICPGLHAPLPKFNGLGISRSYQAKLTAEFGGYIRCYIGYAKNRKIRFEASSGGIATALSAFLLNTKKVDGVVGVKMKEGTPFDTEPMLIRDSDELKNIMGSKYCPAATNSIIKRINDKSLRSILFTGLPCHIQGVNNAQKYRPLRELSNVITIGLFCGGMRGQEGSKWILRKNGIQEQDVKCIKAHRGYGWPGKMIVSLKNGETLSIPYPSGIVDEYFESWQPWRCYMCMDRSSETADISLGDAWGLEKIDENSQGVSLIIARTPKGLQIIEEAIKGKVIEAHEIDSNMVISSQKGLWKDVDRIVKPAIFLRRVLRKSVPQYGIVVEGPNIRTTINLIKLLIGATMRRKKVRSEIN